MRGASHPGPCLPRASVLTCRPSRLPSLPSRRQRHRPLGSGLHIVAELGLLHTCRRHTVLLNPHRHTPLHDSSPPPHGLSQTTNHTANTPAPDYGSTMYQPTISTVFQACTVLLRQCPVHKAMGQNACIANRLCRPQASSTFHNTPYTPSNRTRTTYSTLRIRPRPG